MKNKLKLKEIFIRKPLMDIVSFEYKKNGDWDDKGLEITGISDQSCDIKPGNIFFAVNGNKSHGANYILEAIENGAKLAISDEKGIEIIKNINKDFFTLQVEDVRKSLSICASNWFENQPRNIIAVTGTNGKTSISNFVLQMWENMSLKAVSIGTLGVQGYIEKQTNLTTPGTIEFHKILAGLFQEGIENVIIEASSHGISQSRIDGVKISAAAFTNLSRDHLDYHKNELEYFISKAKLFYTILPENSNSIINLDSDYGSTIKLICEEKSQKVFSIGNQVGSDLHIISIKPLETKQLVKFSFKGKKYVETLSLIGKFQAYNALMSALIVISQGYDDEKVFSELKRLKNVPGRMELVGTKKTGGSVFVDFAHTPDALLKALKALRSHSFGNLFVLFGSGGDRDVGKRSMMGKVAYENSDRAYITDDNPRNEDPKSIRTSIIKGCPNAIEIPDRAEAILRAIKELNEGDILLIAGKGHETGQTIDDITYPFCDAEQASMSILALEGEIP